MTTMLRRRLLQLSGAGIASYLGISQAKRASAQVSSSEASIEINDQTSDGDSLTIASLSSDVDASVRISENTSGPNETYARFEIAGGFSKENYTVELSTPIEESQSIIGRVSIPSQDYDTVAKSRAFVTIGSGEEGPYGISFVEAKPDAGFNYPYFLFTPSPDNDRENVPILVEPNNTGTSSDDFELHKERARKVVRANPGAETSRALTIPLLVPVFPRPRSEPVDYTHYTHQLDRDTLQISDGDLERIDLQLLAMVEDAKERLADTPYTFRDKIMLNGFSASGTFADRFTVLHPEKVLSVTAGGLNGMALLPLEEAKGHTLRYHVGIADVEAITGETVDIDALDEVNQLLYMGENDTNDTIPYDDAWTDDYLRQTALDVYGQDMIEDRFPYSYSAYDEAGVSAQFKVYEDAGHTWSPAFDDIIEFHKRSMNGESVDDFGEVLAAQAMFSIDPATVTIEEGVEFDASSAMSPQGEIQTYTWSFGDGSTAAGEVVTHSFSDAGEFTVTLKIVDSTGSQASTTKTLVVESTDSSPTSTSTTTRESQSNPTTTSPETTTASHQTASTTSTEAPGFGIPTIIGSLSAIVGGTFLERFQNKDS